MRPFITSLSVLVLLAAAAQADDNWPQFRGADSRGISENPNLPQHWSNTENIAWKTPLKGRGWSSPVTWGDKIFLTSVINLEDEEAPKKGLYFGGERPKPESVHQWAVYALDLNTGQPLWQHVVHQGPPQSSIHLKNSFASETPVTDGQRVYFYFGNVGVFAFDLDGKPLWQKPMEMNPTRNGWGTAASPVVYDGRLYIVNDNDRDSYLLCLDAKTGDEVFRVKREEKSNWATPYIWKNSKRVELITPGTGRNRSYDLDGKLLWELGGMSTITIATPYSQDDVLYISSGYVNDRRKPFYAIRPGASGDISLDPDSTSNEYVMWVNRNAGPYNPTSILYDGLIYVLYDQGFFACYDPKTGEEVYGRQRIPEGRAFTASPWANRGKIFCLNEDGVTFVMATGREFKVLDTIPLGDEDEMFMATPALVGDRLIIRSSANVYCIQNSRKAG